MDQHDLAGKILFVFVDVIVNWRDERFVVSKVTAGWGSTGGFLPFAKTFDQLGKRDKWTVRGR